MSKPDLPGFTTLFQKCLFDHDYVDRLFGVTPKPIKDLPQVCTCGAKITYAPLVLFFEHDSLDDYRIDFTVRVADWDTCPLEGEFKEVESVDEDGFKTKSIVFMPKRIKVVTEI